MLQERLNREAEKKETVDHRVHLRPWHLRSGAIMMVVLGVIACAPTHPDQLLIDGVIERNPGKVKLALLTGADAENASLEGRNAILWACSVPYNEDVLEIVQMLIRAGADVHARSPEGCTALVMAIPHKDLLHLLLEAGADPNEPSCEEQLPPLAWSLRWKDAEVVRILLQYGADPLAKLPDGTTVLELAREWKDAPTIALLEQAARQGGLNRTG